MLSGCYIYSCKTQIGVLLSRYPYTFISLVLLNTPTKIRVRYMRIGLEAKCNYKSRDVHMVWVGVSVRVRVRVKINVRVRVRATV